MTTRIATFALVSIALTGSALTGIAAAQPPSPPAEASVTVNGKNITIKYSAPSVRGRKIFGDGGVISHDPTYPVWRAGANSATSMTTDGNLDINGLKVPAGSYTLFVALNGDHDWDLIVNKKTGEWGLAYNKSADLGRVKMTVTKPSAPIETFQISLEATGGNKGKLTLSWDNDVATVPFTVQ
ncbi:MAG: DUF2911 domain-containing protein [Bryobacteraceae bacterium]|jgi:hypothetical protein